MVRDDVVQLLRDAQATLPRLPPPLLGQRPAVAQAALTAHPDHLAEGEDEQRPGEGGGHPGPRPAAIRVTGHGRPVGGEHAGRDEPGRQPVPGDDRRDERHDERGDHRAVGVAEHEVGGRRGTDDRGHEPGPGSVG